MKLTPGKLAGLKAVSDSRHVIAAAAMDQRGSLQKSISKERGAASSGQDLEVFKTLVTEVLTRYASAILLDPEYGLPAAQHRNGKGLLLAYEKTGYDAATAGRPRVGRSRGIDDPGTALSLSPSNSPFRSTVATRPA